MSTTKCPGVLILGYTRPADGVHARCYTCGYDKNLGFNGTVVSLLKAEQTHDELELRGEVVR